MARSRGRSAPAQRSQTRSAHTAAAPAPTRQQSQAPPAAPPMQQQRQPGLFANMASTAAGVAVGSAVGHTLANGVSSIFGGRSEAAPQQYEAAPVAQQSQSGFAQEGGVKCDLDARNLTQCMDQNNGDMRVCQWYMDQLKSCLSASQ